MIDVRTLELLGADYERSKDYYLDRETGNIYVREIWFPEGWNGNGAVAHSELRLLGPVGKPLPHTDGYGALTDRN